MSPKIGAYIHHVTCRCCGDTNLTKVMDFGLMPLAGGFLRKDQLLDEKAYPLHVSFCRDCTLVQVPQAIPPETLFKDYFFFSSAIKTMVEHCTNLAKEIYDQFLKNLTNPSVFEIGCNDGVMLKPFVVLGVKALGMDPATNVVNSVKQEGFTIINDFFNEETAKRVRAGYGQFDVITSCYSFAHIDNMISVIKGLKHLLKDDGVFMFEIYYLGTLMDEMQYDMIYHEHCNYYSLKALKQFFGNYGMEIFDVKFTSGVRAGATSFFVRNIGKRSEPISKSVGEMERYEQEKKLDQIETYLSYAKRVADTKTQLLALLQQLKSQNKKVIGYGASGRGTMIMNYCGIDGSYLDYVVDDAPAKHGFYTPGTHVRIYSWEHVAEEAFPDYAVLFAWSFTDEVLKKRADYTATGGKFIVPLPQVKIVP